MEKELIYFCRHFWMVFRDIAPFWAVGIAAGSFVSVFAKERLNALFARISRGPFALFAASALGIASPLCMYGTIPLAASFSEKGMDDGVLAAFMMSSVLLNPQLMIYTALLGAEALAARTLAVFLCGAAAGLCVRRFFKGRAFFSFEGFALAASRDTDPNMAMRLLKNIGRNIRATAPGLLAGVALTAALIRIIPSRAIAGAFGESGFGVAAAAVIGVPLYFCGGTIPLLAEWLKRGMDIGSALAFMLSGPATKLTNLGALKTVLGAGHFALYIAFSMTFAIAAGYAAAFLI